MHADAALGEFAFGVEIDDVDGAADVFPDHHGRLRMRTYILIIYRTFVRYAMIIYYHISPNWDFCCRMVANMCEQVPQPMGKI